MPYSIWVHILQVSSSVAEPHFCLQIPYTVNYSLVFYFVTEEEITEGSLLHRFISGDDTFRNSRLSLIPAIPEVGIPMILLYSCTSSCLLRHSISRIW